MPAVNIKANTRIARGSGAVTPGNPHVITFPDHTKIVSIMAQASGGTIKVRYSLDDQGVVLWSDWAHGDADASQVWAAAFEGGLYRFEVSGTGDYSYSWD